MVKRHLPSTFSIEPSVASMQAIPNAEQRRVKA
jgi:hypothetical protein